MSITGFHNAAAAFVGALLVSTLFIAAAVPVLPIA